jgi:formyl-CoA transferase
MTNAFPYMSATPGSIRHAGARKGQHNEDVFCSEMGLCAAELQMLKDEGVV